MTLSMQDAELVLQFPQESKVWVVQTAQCITPSVPAAMSKCIQHLVHAGCLIVLLEL